MKSFPKTEIYTFFSVLIGIAGMAMQSWLFSTADSYGLLIHGHIAEILSCLLLAGAAVIGFLSLKNLKFGGEYPQLFPQSPVAAAGNLVAAAGVLFSAFTPAAVGVLTTVVRALGVVAALAFALGGFARLQGKRPNCLLFAAVAVYLIARTLVFCQRWSAEVQVQIYFFPLLAILFLLLAAYYRAALAADFQNCKQYFLFRQLAIVCCLMSMAGGERVFYLAGAVWMATDFCIPEHSGKYAG